MATKPDKKIKTTKTKTPQEDRKATVVKESKTTFEERTATDQPWRNADGSENRGDVVEAEPVVECADA